MTRKIIRRFSHFLDQRANTALGAVALSLLLTMPVLTTPAAAQLTSDSDEPLDITSDRLESEENVATWIGSVRAVQGESILTTERLIITRGDEGDLDTIEAVGTVRFATTEETIAGDKAVYKEEARTITMLGDVIVTQGEQILTGNTLVYWVDTGRLEFTAEEGKRIRGIFQTDSIDNQS
ncbi:MAG: LptA/OstA family protein [Pseudomonadota bacterium]